MLVVVVTEFEWCRSDANVCLRITWGGDVALVHYVRLEAVRFKWAGVWIYTVTRVMQGLWTRGADFPNVIYIS